MIHPETKKTTIYTMIGVVLIIAIVFFTLFFFVGCSSKTTVKKQNYSVDDPRRSYNKDMYPVKQHKPNIKNE